MTAKVYILGRPVPFEHHADGTRAIAVTSMKSRVLSMRGRVLADPSAACEIDRLFCKATFSEPYAGTISGEYCPLVEVLRGETDLYAGSGLAPQAKLGDTSTSYINTRCNYAGTLRKVTVVNDKLTDRLSETCLLELDAFKARVWVDLDVGQQWNGDQVDWRSATDINRRSISV